RCLRARKRAEVKVRGATPPGMGSKTSRRAFCSTTSRPLLVSAVSPLSRNLDLLWFDAVQCCGSRDGWKQLLSAQSGHGAKNQFVYRRLGQKREERRKSRFLATRALTR